MNKITTKLNPEGFYLMEDGTVSKYHGSVYSINDVWDMRKEAKQLENEGKNK